MGSTAQGDKYEPLLELGRGGMATVYLAVVRGPGGFQKLQVIKRLRRDVVAEAPEMLEMFLDEARLAARINHPNVVQTFEVGEDSQGHFIAMEYLEGQPLSSLVRQAKNDFPLTLHLRILSDVLAGLHAAHELKDFDGTQLDVVHRDVSPHNVIVTYTGAAKVVDFGIAKAADSSSETRSGVVKGKYAYMSPEQFLGGGVRVDRRADVYAVGVLLWQALTGARLWPRGTNDAEIMLRVSTGDLPLPSSRKSDVPPILEEICMKALARKREDRWSTAAEMQAQIERYLDKVEPRPQAEDVGRFVRETFTTDRAALEEAIQKRIQERKRGSDSVPDLASLVPMAPISSSSLASAASAAAAGEIDVAFPPVQPDDGALTRSLATNATKGGSAPPSRRRAVFVAATLAALASVAAFFAVTRRAPPEPTKEVPSSAAASTTAPTPSASIASATPEAPTAAPSAPSAAPLASASPAPVAPAALPATARNPATATTAKTPIPATSAPAAQTSTRRKPKVDDADPWK